ncbi:hypothetical protein FB45DRAFT_871694 [Roridomyces roridus]|uniref:NAD(P)-binding protein n=1 Tax=Roridomyces roridus TaxID=1738132 RepID=A0AAD7FGY5_9AGAR|nr:hypothetical protein FB45DRAFT_871694 [Roridomyces roridus]
MSRLIAFIIGSGPNIGQHTSAALKAKGYQVALGSRKPVVEQVKKDGYFPVALDITRPETIKEAFASVNKELGPPSVVIFNGSVFSAPPIPDDPLSTPLEKFTEMSAVALSVFAAAQEAVAAFRAESNKDALKTFIITGNPTPWQPFWKTSFFSGVLHKTDEWRMTELLAHAYAKEKFRFYFASLVNAETGGVLDPLSEFWTSGPQHAKVYTDLATWPDQADWDYRFTLKAEQWEKARG